MILHRALRRQHGETETFLLGTPIAELGAFLGEGVFGAQSPLGDAITDCLAPGNSAASGYFSGTLRVSVTLLDAAPYRVRAPDLTMAGAYCGLPMPCSFAFSSSASLTRS